MSGFRLYPTSGQEGALLSHGAHARFVWNLAVEQQGMYTPRKGPVPGYVGRCRQVTGARGAFAWLSAGSQTVRQQALRDFAQAVADFFRGTHRRPRWRKAGVDEGFRIAGAQAQRVERLGGNVGRVWVPKAGWVRFRWSRSVPDAKSYRITRDRAGRWFVAFAAVPEPVAAPATGARVGVDRGVAVSAALSTGELPTVPGLRPKEAERLVRLRRELVRARKGSNRRAEIKARIARPRARQVDRRKDRAGQTGTRLAREFDLIAPEALSVRAMTRQAVFRCRACGHTANADVNAARNILDLAAGRAVTARGGTGMPGPTNREPQHCHAS